jgi:putative membrane protein
MVVALTSLSAEERAQIEAAVTAAERQTSAELAVVIARESDAYGSYPLLWAAVLSLLVGGAAPFLEPDLEPTFLFAGQVGLFIVLGLLFHWGPIRYLLVPDTIKRKRTSDMARLQFLSLVDDKTPDEAGVLLFVSLAEHHVEILVDGGVARILSEDTWKKIVDEFLGAVRQDRLADGLLKAIRQCGDALALPFPPHPGTVNDIPDRVVEI